MRSTQNQPRHAPKEALALSLMIVLAVCAEGALATAPGQGGELRSDRTVSLGVQIDRAGMQVVSFTLKDRPFQGPAEPAQVRPFRGVGIVQIEVQLVGDGADSFLRRVELGPLCFEHGPDAPPHIQGDTITVHRDAFLVELPEIQGMDRVEIAYYEEHLGVVSRKTLGTDRLGESRFTPAGGPFSYSDLSFATTESGTTREAMSSTALWPEDFDDPDIYQIYGDPTDGANRVNIVIVPDGYTYAEKALMETHASNMVASFRAKTPYTQHDSFINYTLVYAYSVDSGTDQCDCGIILDSAMGTRFPDAGYPCQDSGNRCLYYGGGCDTSGTTNIVEAEQRAPFHDETIVMVNTPRYGGCGGARAVYSAGNSAGLEVAIHELGHSLAGLADEYAYSAGCGNNSGERNTSLDPVEGAWPEWIADLGAPREGAQYFQSCIFRPLNNCEMRELYQPFCPVCNQRWALVFFGHPRVNPTAPISSASPESPTSAVVGVPRTFTVITRLATDVTNEIEWTLEGPGYPEPTVVASGVTEYEATFASVGQYILRCRVTADTNFIKPEKNGVNEDTSLWHVFVNFSEDATAILPFMDNFPSTDLDTSLWIGNDGAGVDDVGNGEPSPPFSLNIDGTEEIRSALMDTSGGGLVLAYFWQRAGGGNAPEAGDDLFVEYLNNVGEWVEIANHPGDGPHDDPYASVSIPLPPDALHADFRVRFRTVGTLGGQPEGFDDWFVDNVCVGTPAECAGASNCNEACPTDLDGDNNTGPFDLATLLGCWGPISPGDCLCLDADGDGQIGPFDLAGLLGAWGVCP